MKLGYFTLTDNPVVYGSDRKDPHKLLTELTEECILADQLGYYSVWVPEHHYGYLGVLPSPSMFLAHVAQHTKHVKLGPATVLFPTSHPVRMAEEYALLDVLSNGRAIFSAGRGYDEKEYEVVEADFDNNREIFFEQMEIITKAWTNKSFSFKGKHYNIPEVEIVPAPLQKPHPDIYIASFSKPSLEKAAQLGVNAMIAFFGAVKSYGSIQEATDYFNKLYAEYGNKKPKVTCSYFINVAESKEDIQYGKERMVKYFRGTLGALPTGYTKNKSYDYFKGRPEQVKNMTPDTVDDRTLINGDVDYCISRLKELEVAGIDETILYFNYGGQDTRKTRKQMETFAKYVLPHFS